MKDTRSLIERHRALRVASPIVVVLILVAIRMTPYMLCLRGASVEPNLPVYFAMLGLVALGALVAYGIMMWDKHTWK